MVVPDPEGVFGEGEPEVEVVPVNVRVELGGRGEPALVLIGVVVDVLCALAVQQKVYFSWRPYLIDPGDDMVLEVALAAGTPYIITNNARHFRGCDSLGIKAITPAEALTLIRP